MSQSFGLPTVSGFDPGALSRQNAVPGTNASTARTWFDSDTVASGSITLPAGPAGQGIQDLDRLVDTIVSPIRA